MTDTAIAGAWRLDHARASALADATAADPFAILGPHRIADGTIVRAFLPGATAVEVVRRSDGTLIGRLGRSECDGLFEGLLKDFAPYRLRISWPGSAQETEDPYSFGLLLGDLDLHLFNEGRHFGLADAFGAQVRSIDGVAGVCFAVWAPNAKRVAVVGDFNSWDERRHPMRARYPAGVWELFVPRIGPGERYKYDIIGPQGDRVPLKADPLARQAEPAPGTASIVVAPDGFHWRDDRWMAARAFSYDAKAPISIYEVHLGSWFRRDEHEKHVEAWDKAIARLVPYVADMGFTHVELLPITEHPFGGSWGYQPLALFAPTARYGTRSGFARFVDAMHGAGIGVILDSVPAHFPTDTHGLARFDGTALYEHLDPREGFHRDWNTFIYNFGRRDLFTPSANPTGSTTWPRPSAQVSSEAATCISSLRTMPTSRAICVAISTRSGTMTLIMCSTFF
jgi:1,4-alpha-glucan branching enzyme